MTTTLIHGDCLEELKKIQNGSIDLVIADLPYGQTNCEWDTCVDITKLWEELKRIGKDKTAFIFFCTTKFGYSLIESNKSWFRYDLIWEKEGCRAGFLNARKMPMRTHEMIYVFYKKLPTYNIEDNHQRIEREVECLKSTKKNPGHIYTTGSNSGKNHGPSWTPLLPRSIIKTNVKENKNHPTEKPQSILEWIVKYYSKKGDTILDPTMGSGSLGVACKTLERTFIGIEKEERFFQIAQNRIS